MKPHIAVAIEVLERVLRRIPNASALAKGTSARDAKGEPCSPWSAIAVSWDVYSAIEIEAINGSHRDTASYNAAVLIRAVTKRRTVQEWNDDETTSFEDVVRVIREAIDLGKRAG